MMMILLFSVMSGAPQLLNSVIEEKMSRISEVLIGSITPFELMMGKLSGASRCRSCSPRSTSPAASGWRSTTATATRSASADVAWLLLFLLMASFMFGSIFITIGAACSDLKDAQGMMTPAMLIMMFPWMTWFAILNAPDSTMSVALSMFPTNAPFLMLLRIMLPPGPPVWQIVVSVVLAAADVGRGRGLRGRQDLPHRPADAGQGGDVRRDVEVGARRLEVGGSDRIGSSPAS